MLDETSPRPMSILGSWWIRPLVWYTFWVPLNAIRLWAAVALAHLGDPSLQYRAGKAYMDYRVGAMAPAAKWFERAASQGHARSQFEIGLHYAYGFGVAQDLKRAEEWPRLAVRNGQVEARLSLEGLKHLSRSDARAD
jgi:TPR repeat protein